MCGYEGVCGGGGWMVGMGLVRGVVGGGVVVWGLPATAHPHNPLKNPAPPPPLRRAGEEGGVQLFEAG